MNRYAKLIIPFGSKKYIKKENKGLIIHGNAFFIWDLNKGKIIDEYIQLISGNYRLTDSDMIKPTKYYEQVQIKDFRDHYLDQYSKKDPKHISKTTYHNLTDEQIKNVNDYLKEKCMTIKTMFSLFTGSNASGAETNHKASQIRCIDNKYFDCNFANVVSLYIGEKTKNYPKEIKAYSLETFIKENIIKDFKTTFLKYNEHLEFEDNIHVPYYDKEVEVQKYYPDLSKDIEFKLKENQELFIYSIINKTINKYEELIDKNMDKLRQRLRSFFNANINFYLKEGKIPYHYTKEKFNLNIIENAHIFSLASLVKNLSYDDLKLSVNPYNCLRIDRNTHKIIDDKKYFFDTNGNLIKQNKQIVCKEYLDMENLPKETKKILNKYWQSSNLL